MDQLWGVLGRAYIDTVFRDSLVTAALADTPGAAEPEKDVAKLATLDTFLSNEGFRASRFDRGEIHRVCFILDQQQSKPDAQNPLRAMGRLSTVAATTLSAPGAKALPARSMELWSLIGLCAIDTVLREHYTAPGANIGVLIGTPPQFFLSPEEGAFASALFASPECKGALGTFEENCWIPPQNPAEVLSELSGQLAQIADEIRNNNNKPLPKVQCSTGYTREIPTGTEVKKRTYKHLAAPLADSITAAVVALQ